MVALKRLIIITLTVVALVILAAFSAPALFGDKIRALVDEQIDNYLDADVTYGDVSFSILRNFPQLSMVVQDITLDGRAAFDSVRLAAIDEFAITVDFWSAIGEGPLQLKEVELIHPVLNVVVDNTGRINTDILKPEQEPTSSSDSAPTDFQINLQHYVIEQGELAYNDQQANLSARLKGFNHTGTGDFSSTQFELHTKTDVDEVDVISDGVTYLRNTSLKYEAKFDINTEVGQVSLAENLLQLNELEVAAEGNVSFPQEDGTITVDLALATPQQDFRALWSVIPAVFARELDGLKTSGEFSLAGTVKGDYVPATLRYPALAFELVVNGGSVQYPGLPKALSGIDLKAGLRSAGADLADLLVDVQRFKVKLGENSFSGSLRVLQSLANPNFKLATSGRIDLADIAEAVPLEGVEKMAGQITLDITAEGDAQNAQRDLSSIESAGLAEFQDIVYVAVGIPSVGINAGKAKFSQTAVTLEDFELTAGRSDMRVNGVINNPFFVLGETGIVTGQLEARGKLLDANEWLEPTAGESSQAAPEIASSTVPFDRFAFDFEGNFEEVNYDVYDLLQVSASGRFSPEELTLKQSAFTLGQSDIRLSGVLANVFGYTYSDEELTGRLQLESKRLDLLELSAIGTDSSSGTLTTTTESTGYIPLPERMSLRIASSVDQLRYDDILVESVNGVIGLANQTAAIEQGTGKMLGGNIKVDGGYQYLGPDTQPTFDFTYDIQNASFVQAFEQLNTVQQLAPIAKLLSGSFNTNLVMSSALGPDMMPDLTTLSADGFIATLNATLASLPALQTASEKLGIKELQGLDLSNTKNWFTVENGVVDVKPFDVKWGGIDATIAGSHGLDRAMSYEIIALVPREKLGKVTGGAAVNKGIDFLSGQASNLGIDLDVGDFVRLKIGITGSLEDPKVAIKLLGTEGESTVKDAAKDALAAAAQQARDSINRLAQQKLDEARREAQDRAHAIADSVRTAAEERARLAAEQARVKAKAEADRLAQKAAAEAKAKATEEARKAAEAAANKVGEEAKDKATDALKGLFGRKKKPDQ